VLITGSNQGIGYEFAKQYARKDWRVIATHRRDSEPESLVALREKYPNIEIEMLDVTKQNTIDALAGKLTGQPIDVLINNAGWPGNFMGSPQQFGTLDFGELPAVMDSMTVGVMRVTQAFIEHVRASESKTVTVITSETGMFSAVLEGLVPHNRAFWLGASKAAINYLFTKMAFEQKDSGVIYLMLDPGLVRDTNEQARMRAEGKEAPQIPILPGMPERVNIDVAVGGMIKVTDGATPADSGKIYKYDGKKLEY
jgi:NAD(P)-dependent dehydrogenase (short-subunit alcohol dehydrogenase family)